MDDVEPDLNAAYKQFYGGGYVDGGKSVDVDNITGTGESRILSLKNNVIDIRDRIRTLKTKLPQLIQTKENELTTLKRRYRQALAAEAAEDE